MANAPSSQRPIATLLQQELKQILVALAVLIAAAMGLFSLFMVRSNAHGAAELVMIQSISISRAASNSGDLLSIERDLNRFTTSWQASQPLKARVQISMDGRLVASAGPTDSITGMKHELQTQLKLESGKQLSIQVQIGKNQAFLNAFFILLILEAFLISIFWMLNRRLTLSLKRLTSPLEQTAEWLKRAAGNLPKSVSLVSTSDNPDILEVASLQNSVGILLSAIEKYDAELSHAKFNQARIEVSEQVSHDIRSPLTTLEVSLSRAEGLSPNERSLLQSVAARIRDIANSLQTRRERPKSAVAEDPPETQDLKPQLLQPLLENLASQKRAQYQSVPHVTIRVDHSAETYGLFAKIQPSELVRAISNLVDNAAEACTGEGMIEISAKPRGEMIEVRISDTGAGIAETLLPRLGERGVTFGKPSGTGLGLHYAKSCAERWGGRLLIASQSGMGTHVSLLLPRAPVPAWFCPTIQIADGGALIVVDDDPTIRLLWKSRQERLWTETHSLPPFRLVTLESGDALRIWIQNHQKLAAQSCFLMDYDLGPDQSNGLELIELLGIENQSTLVTSRYADPDIVAWCYLLGVPRIPKNSLGIVPVLSLDPPVHAIACIETRSASTGG